jgi:hypothetical protein
MIMIIMIGWPGRTAPGRWQVAADGFTAQSDLPHRDSEDHDTTAERQQPQFAGPASAARAGAADSDLAASEFTGPVPGQAAGRRRGYHVTYQPKVMDTVTTVDS